LELNDSFGSVASVLEQICVDVDAYGRASQLMEIVSSRPAWPHGERDLAVAKEFGDLAAHTLRLLQESDSAGCLLRHHFPAHFTASAFIVTPDYSRTLLTFHKKLQKWLQLGGHIDDGENPQAAALREASEESGLETTSLSPSRLFGPQHLLDIDIHEIPSTALEPAHRHFDFRFLFVAEQPEAIQISDESLDLRWVACDEVQSISHEASLLRMVNKIHLLRSRA
jgi:8-oxo-dGTP pyrophosphatase MutT (NUDIX family)